MTRSPHRTGVRPVPETYCWPLVIDCLFLPFSSFLHPQWACLCGLSPAFPLRRNGLFSQQQAGEVSAGDCDTLLSVTFLKDLWSFLPTRGAWPPPLTLAVIWDQEMEMREVGQLLGRGGMDSPLCDIGQKTWVLWGPAPFPVHGAAAVHIGLVREASVPWWMETACAFREWQFLGCNGLAHSPRNTPRKGERESYLLREYSLLFFRELPSWGFTHSARIY